MPALAAPEKLTLDQRKVAELVLTQSDRAKETNYTADLPRETYSNELAKYDWGLRITSGYEMSKFENFNNSHNAKDEFLRSNILFGRNWTTGTMTSITYERNSIQSEFYPGNVFGERPSRQTQDIFGFHIEQSLWRNAFGYGDRAALRAAKKTVEAATIS